MRLNSESRETTKKICVAPAGDVSGTLEYHSHREPGTVERTGQLFPKR